jgi:hypothetical protein
MKRNAIDVAGLVTAMGRPNGAVAVKSDKRAAWLVAGAIVLVITVVASPFSAADDAYSGCQHVQSSDGSTTEIPCDETVADSAGSSPQRVTP